MFNNYPDVMTPQLVAEALGVNVKSVYALIRDQVLGCKRIGRKYIIPKICLQQYVRSAQYTVKQ